MEVRLSIRHGLISSSYLSYFKFSVTIDALAFALSFPLSGGFETHPLETPAVCRTYKKHLTKADISVRCFTYS